MTDCKISRQSWHWRVDRERTIRQSVIIINLQIKNTKNAKSGVRLKQPELQSVVRSESTLQRQLWPEILMNTP
jgi:hypothetical protein